MGKAVVQLTWLLVIAAGALIAVGTVVSGAGRHAGDSSEVERIPVDWSMIAQLHADFAWVVVALTAALWFVLKAVDAPAGPLHRARDLFLILMAQGVIGYIQYFTHTPEILVGLHMFGATLVWIGVMRVLLSLRERPHSGAGIPAQSEDPALTAV